MSTREGDEQARDCQAKKTADAVARRSYGKLVAFLAARTHDVAAAEDALSEAFPSALADWPRNGCPANPEAWLLTVARRKVIDAAAAALDHGGRDDGAADHCRGSGSGRGGARRFRTSVWR